MKGITWTMRIPLHKWLVLGAVKVKHNHLEAEGVKQKYYNWLQFLEGFGVVDYFIIKICVDCWIVRYGVFKKPLEIFKKNAMSLLNVFKKILQVFSKIPIKNSIVR